MGTVCTVPATLVGKPDMPIVLYQYPVSPPCRAVIMTCKHLGIDLTLKEIDLLKKEQLKPEFIKLNPTHSLPTIDDNGFIIWESRAILGYLVNKYAPGNPIYPDDPQKRAEVDKMLYFDVGTYYKRQMDFLFPQIYQGAPPDEVKEKAFRDILAILNEFLAKKPYVAGDCVTIADLSILSEMTFAEATDFDFSEYKNLTEWKEKLENELPYYKEVNEEPLKGFRQWLKEKK